MTADNNHSDAERIAVGLDPVQGEQLDDIDDVWRVLRRLGHKPGDSIPTTVWDFVDWSCPLDDCNGGVEPVDTRMYELPANTDDLDESIDPDDPQLHLRLNTARSPTVPLVTCYKCGSVFKITFRRLPEPEERRLPKPCIVETPEILNGRPRIDGTRIGVEHVMAFYNRGHNAEDIALDVYPRLSEKHVQVAIEWAKAHPGRMAALRREDEELRLQHDLFQSAVDAGVTECIDEIWSLMVNAKATGGDPVRPVSNLLRNGFETADGLRIELDTEQRRVVISVDASLTDTGDSSDS